MAGATARDPKDIVYAAILKAFADIPIPRTVKTGNGWFFLYNTVPTSIGKMIKLIFSLDGIFLVDVTTISLEWVIYHTLKDAMHSGSDQVRVMALQLELSGEGDKFLYDIIESAIKVLPENSWRSGRYLKDEAARKKFISRIIDEFFSQKIGIIMSPAECMSLVQSARRRYASIQDQAAFLYREFKKKRIAAKP
ncbi:MAG: hypothetical protein HYT37_01150 [Candidatus Sungbacteria bacterium]|nr:hypothetical protein [Candidatus Sungbacteria bacterium]